MELDRTDFGILSLLQNDASLSNKQVAAAIGLAPSSAHERVKRLREAGVLRGAHADVAPAVLRRPIDDDGVTAAGFADKADAFQPFDSGLHNIILII